MLVQRWILNNYNLARYMQEQGSHSFELFEILWFFHIYEFPIVQLWPRFFFLIPETIGLLRSYQFIRNYNCMGILLFVCKLSQISVFFLAHKSKLFNTVLFIFHNIPWLKWKFHAFLGFPWPV